jgi:hypothetical protein
MGIKRCRILRRFQKYKLTLVAKCTKKVIQETRISLGWVDFGLVLQFQQKYP